MITIPTANAPTRKRIPPPAKVNPATFAAFLQQHQIFFYLSLRTPSYCAGNTPIVENLIPGFSIEKRLRHVEIFCIYTRINKQNYH